MKSLSAPTVGAFLASTELMTEKDTGDKYGRSKAVVNEENQVNRIRGELKDLKKSVAKEMEKYEKAVKGGKSKATASFQSQMHLHSSFELHSELAQYILVVEIPMPIEEVILQSSVPIDLVGTDDSSAILCQTACSWVLECHSGDLPLSGFQYAKV